MMNRLLPFVLVGVGELLPVIGGELVTEGMVTLEAVRILKYVASPPGA